MLKPPEWTFQDKNNSAQKKLRSRDIMPSTGNKFNDLYLLSKNLKTKQTQEKTTEEIEFERAREECTFTPNVKRESKILPNNEKENQVKISDDRFVVREIERMKKAREERERIKKFTERGIFLNNNHKQTKI